MTSENCRPGFVLSFCSSIYNNRDASCSQACDPAEFGKPDDDSVAEWVWTTYNTTTGEMVENPTGGADGMPNVGCMWKCKQGYALRTMDAGGGAEKRVSFCIRDQG